MNIFPYLLLEERHRFQMRLPEESDYPYIAEWMATYTGSSGAEKERLRAVLLDHLLATASLCRKQCRVGVYDGERIFYLELAGFTELYVTVNPAVQA